MRFFLVVIFLLMELSCARAETNEGVIVLSHKQVNISSYQIGNLMVSDVMHHDGRRGTLVQIGSVAFQIPLRVHAVVALFRITTALLIIVSISFLARRFNRGIKERGCRQLP
jgi:hypothetical protein